MMVKPHLRYSSGRWYVYRSRDTMKAPTTCRETVKDAHQAHIQWLKYIEEI